MTNHRRWIALLLCAIVTISSVSVLADNTPANQDQPALPYEQAQQQIIKTDLAQENEVSDQKADPEPEETEEALPDPDRIKITLNGEPLELEIDPVLQGSATYVPLRAFCEAMGCSVSWNGNTTIITRGSDLKMTVSNTSELVEANDRFFYMPGKPVNIGGNLMVPIRGLSKVFSLEIGWNESTKTVALTGGQVMAWAQDYYDQNDLLWLSRIIHAESQGESLDGKIAVGNVILSRTQSSLFPNTIYDVIFDNKFGTQFTPAKTGKINNTPNEESVLAAKLCLEGHQTVENALYFLNTAAATSNWIVRNRSFIVKIGNHSFYS